MASEAHKPPARGDPIPIRNARHRLVACPETAVEKTSNLDVSPDDSGALYDGSVETWEILALVRSCYRCVSDRRHEFHWDAARRKFHLQTKTTRTKDEDATQFVELRMCEEALGSWEKRGGRPRRLKLGAGPGVQDARGRADHWDSGYRGGQAGNQQKAPAPKRAVKQAGSGAAKSRALFLIGDAAPSTPKINQTAGWQVRFLGDLTPPRADGTTRTGPRGEPW